MRKTHIKISWDLEQKLKQLTKELSEFKGKKLSFDSSIRYLLDFREKIHQNALNEQIKLSMGGDEE